MRSLTEAQLHAASDIWSNEPVRNSTLIARTQRPCNAETPADALMASFITPNELFFVRNHLPVPVVDKEAYQLEIVGVPGRTEPLRLSLSELKTQFPKYSITSTIQCSGNRRSQMTAPNSPPVRGLGWNTNAISTATWSGARLIDVLRYAGVTSVDTLPVDIAHVQFEGLDRDTEAGYGGSLPVAKAMNPASDILIAYEMNGFFLRTEYLLWCV